MFFYDSLSDEDDKQLHLPLQSTIQTLWVSRHASNLQSTNERHFRPSGLFGECPQSQRTGRPCSDPVADATLTCSTRYELCNPLRIYYSGPVPLLAISLRFDNIKSLKCSLNASQCLEDRYFFYLLPYILYTHGNEANWNFTESLNQVIISQQMLDWQLYVIISR